MRDKVRRTKGFFQQYSLESMIEEAISYLVSNEPPEGYFLADSGGKDSIVIRKLAELSGVKHQTYYSATGIDPPEVVRFIKEFHPEAIWIRPKMSFYEGIYSISPPIRIQRWCCDVLKKDEAKKIPLPYRIVGLRKEESLARASRPRTSKISKQMIHIKPIFNWLEWAIWDFIEYFKLPYPSLYDEGFSRIGCVVCPFICSPDLAQINRNRTRWPGIYKAFEHACKRWYTDKHRKEGESFESYMKWWYSGVLEKTDNTFHFGKIK